MIAHGRASETYIICVCVRIEVGWYCTSSTCDGTGKVETEMYTVYREKIAPRFIFALFALCHVGEFKTGLIEISIKDYVRKFESGRIQDWANQF